ncbi:MAG: galactose-1-phosphate uridylyltransferase [Candidatus Methylomirabilales bacterium]
MSELRKDPITGRWVIISAERGRRPSDFGGEPSPRPSRPCPFCPGNEEKTPPEILAYRNDGGTPNSPGWSVRVVANKFPALVAEGDLNREGEGIYDRMSGVGVHEVIIETPNHEEDLTTMSESQIEDVLWAYRDRICDLGKDPRLQYVLIFKNRGEAAGASLDHPHSQLIATPIIPERVQEEMDGARQYYDSKQSCVYCDMIRQELAQQKRVVSVNEHFVAITPFASRFPFETWILPQAHDAFFEDAGKQEHLSLARILQEVLRRLERVLVNPPYNFVVHNSPLRGYDHLPYHWHLEITPRITRVAGFEWGTGIYINPSAPEEAAQSLQAASSDG